MVTCNLKGQESRPRLAWPPGSHTHCPCARACPRPLALLVLVTVISLQNFPCWASSSFPTNYFPSQTFTFTYGQKILDPGFIAVVSVDEILTMVTPKKHPACSSWFGPGAGVSFLPQLKIHQGRQIAHQSFIPTVPAWEERALAWLPIAPDLATMCVRVQGLGRGAGRPIQDCGGTLNVTVGVQCVTAG